MILRPPTRDDAEAIFAVMVARDIADIGHPDIALEDVYADWETPGIDPQLDCVVATSDDGVDVLGYALIDHRSAMVIVHPEFEGRGVGTALRERMEARARERGQPIDQAISAGNTGGLEHLRRAGYQVGHVYQRMAASLDAVPPPPPDVPVRRYDVDSEGPAVHALVAEAFDEIEGNVTDPLDTWLAYVRAKSAPEFRLAIDDEHGLAGVATGERWEDGVGYVAEVAVAPRARGRGYGRALLLAMFEAFRAAGLAKAELSVHGRNLTAFGLYESAGMSPAFRQERWVRP
jgi:ribosomal protein S18 acetylase RimI-like enzyme